METGLFASLVLSVFPKPTIVFVIPLTVPVKVGEAIFAFSARPDVTSDVFAFKSKAACAEVDSGLFASLVLSTFPKPTIVFVTPLTVPVKVGEAIFAFSARSDVTSDVFAFSARLLFTSDEFAFKLILLLNELVSDFCSNKDVSAIFNFKVKLFATSDALAFELILLLNVVVSNAFAASIFGVTYFIKLSASDTFDFNCAFIYAESKTKAALI